MGIRRWLRGTFRADRFEADEVDAGSVNADEATIDGSRVYVQAEEPEDPDEEDVWIDTSE